MKQKCDTCGGWLEYTDSDNGYDYYMCISCGKEYRFGYSVSACADNRVEIGNKRNVNFCK